MSPFAQTILRQKYAQKKTDGTLETWEDVAHRVARNIVGPVFPADENKLRELVTQRKFVPGGRYLYAAGREFQALNNCLAGETRVLTSEGIHEISSLVGKDVEVLDGDGNWVSATAKSYGIQTLRKVVLSRQGRSIEVYATAGHRWVLRDSEVTTDELKPGDKLKIASTQPYPRSGKARLSRIGVQAGFTFGDGSRNPRSRYSARANFCGDKDTALVPWFDDAPVPQKNGTGLIDGLPRFYKDLPALDECLTYLYGWLAGYFAADGCVSTEGCITISSSKRSNLEHVSAVAALLGIGTFPIRKQDRLGFGEEESELFLLTFDGSTLVPDFFLTEVHRARFEDRLSRGIRRIAAWGVVSVEETNRVEEVYCYEIPTTHSFVLEGGVLTGNCFTLFAEDSREGWAKLLHDATHCLMSGGGIGVHYTAIRPNGAPVGGLGGVCTGPIALMEAVNEIGRQVQAGGSRRSAMYASLHWYHPDVFDFIKLKDWTPEIVELKAKDFNARAPMDMTNISVVLDDDFFAVMDGDKESVSFRLGNMDYQVGRDHAERVYSALVRNMLTTGEPGIQIDVGENAGEHGRNAPLGAETHVLTDEGYQRIVDIVDTPVTVWTGQQWAHDVVFKETNPNAETVRVTLTGGREIVAEPTHPFLLEDGSRVAAAELTKGMRLAIDKPDSSPDVFDLDEYTLGLMYGDGSFGRKGHEITLCGDKKELLPYITGYRSITNPDSRGHARIYFKREAFEGMSKDRVPGRLVTTSFLAGLFDADGSFDVKRKTLRLGSIHFDFLRDIQRGLESVGILSHINRSGKSGYGSVRAQYLLVVAAPSVSDFARLIPTRRLKVEMRSAYRKPYIKVESITPDARQPAYCADVKVAEHSFMAEGVVVANCTELTTRDHLDVCNLGSLNLAQYDTLEEFREGVEYATRFLLAGTIVGAMPNEESKSVRERTRRLGLGLMGVYEWLVKRGYPYARNEELAEWLAVYRDVSRQVADEAADSLGVSRPVKVRAVAPTGTLAILAECTSGIEPLFATAYKRRYLRGTTWHYQYVVDAGARRLVEDLGIQPDELETAYALAYHPERRVDFQAFIQEYVDHGISSTLNLPAYVGDIIDGDEFAAMLYRYLPKLRGITAYPDGARGGQPLTVVPYAEAAASEGTEFEEVGNSQPSCASGVCGI